MSERNETRVKDGVTWPVGGQAEVDWITEDTKRGRRITAAIPAVFDAYATLTNHPGGPDLPRDASLERRQDPALVELLRRHSRALSWWIGYLDTGASDIVFWDAPKGTLYAGWHYVMILAGPDQAATWRPASGARANWKSTELPELMFPQDRSWLVSWVAVVPGGFGLQPAGVAVAGLGDVPSVLLLAGGVLGGGDPEPRREFARVSEAVEVADLCDQPQGGEGRGSAESHERLDLGGPPFADRDLLELGIERSELPLDAVEVDQHLLKRHLGEWTVESLPRDPTRDAPWPMPSCPRGRSGRDAAAASRRGGVLQCARCADRRGSAAGPAALRSRV
jgi:hypothetical protein